MIGQSQAPVGIESQDTAAWIYAVVDDPAVVPAGLLGVGDGPVGTVEHGGLAAVVGALQLDRAPKHRADLVAHSKVLEELRNHGTVVPVQFGSVMQDLESVRSDLLEDRVDELRALLDQLRGRFQYNLRARYVEEQVLSEIVRDDPEVSELRRLTRDVPDEAAYGEKVRLGELVNHHLEAKRDVDARFLLDTVLPHTVAHVVKRTGGMNVLDAALLVEESRAEEFVDLLEDLAEGVHERMRLQVVGPVAAFDFTGGL